MKLRNFMGGRGRVRLFVLAALAAQGAMHAPLISLPFFWDEAGYYVPAAHDFRTLSSLIPQTVPTSGHPPLLSIYTSLWWVALGQSVWSARLGILIISAAGLWGVFRLGRLVGNSQIGALAAVCTAIYPCYFAQSTMILPDLPSAAFSILGLSYCWEGKRRAALLFCIAVGLKETALLVPLGVLIADFILSRTPLGLSAASGFLPRNSHASFFSFRHLLWLGLPGGLLLIWYMFHLAKTGVIFGNDEFFSYNVARNLSISRFFVAFAIRIWQAFGHLGMLVPSLGVCSVLAWRAWKGPQASVAVSGLDVFRIGAIVLVHLVALSLLGGALLTRYLLPVIPLILIVALGKVRRRLLFSAAIAASFIVNLFAALPYHYAVEENLVYKHFVSVHQRAAAFLEERYQDAVVVTAWPATFELERPELGYVKQPVAVIDVGDVETSALSQLAARGQHYDFVLVFNRQYQPPDSWLRPRRILSRFGFWQKADSWFGSRESHSSERLTARLQMEEVRTWHEGPFYAALLKRSARSSWAEPQTPQEAPGESP